MKISDRLKAWFTPQMLLPTEIILEHLEKLAAEYDKGQPDITVGKIREIFEASDKLQAELWRRHVSED